MIRILLTIAATSLIVCMLSIGGFVALGGVQSIMDGDFEFGSRDYDHDHRHIVRRNGRVENRERAERTLAWTGGDALTLDMSADVSFTQAPETSIIVTGPKQLVDRVTITDGRLSLKSLDGDDGFHMSMGHRGTLRIRITAPAVRSFTINGSADLDIRNYDQPDLDLRINGSGDVRGVGKTADLTVRISGSGEADFSGLTAGKADVSIAGSGDAEIDPVDAAAVSIAGSGDVTLRRRPANLSSNVAGSGDLIIND
jgi:hypothetical protein